MDAEQPRGWLPGLLGLTVGLLVPALTRAGAQLVDDAQLQASMGVWAFAFAGGVLTAGLNADGDAARTGRLRIRALALFALSLPIGALAWLRLTALRTSDGYVLACAAAMALPFAFAGRAVVVSIHHHDGQRALARFVLGAGLSVSLSLVGASSAPSKLINWGCLSAVLVALASRRIETRTKPTWRWALALGLSIGVVAASDPWSFAVVEPAPQLATARAARERLATRGLELAHAGRGRSADRDHAPTAADDWDSAGHVAALEIGKWSEGHRDATGWGILLEDASERGPLVSYPALMPSCKRTLLGLAFEGAPARVLIAGTGGGHELLCALEHGARQVDVAEPSSAQLAALHDLRSRWTARATPAQHVAMHAISARNFVRSQTGRGYDRIVVPARRGKHSLPAAALALPEWLLETDAGLAELLRALAPGGSLYLIADGEPTALRLAATAHAALRLTGEDQPQDHVVVHGALGSYLVRAQRSSFTLDDVLALHARDHEPRPPSVDRGPTFVELWHGAFESPKLLYTPGAGFENRFGLLLAHADDPAGFQRTYSFNVSPTNDDRPLFNDLTRADAVGILRAADSSAALAWTALMLPVCAVLLLVGCWSRLPGAKDASAGAVIALSALGAGSLLAFACMAHRLALWLPRPGQGYIMCALAVALGASAGLRCGERARVPGRSRALRMHAVALVVLALNAMAFEPLRRTPGFVFGSFAAAALGFALVLPACTWRARGAAASTRGRDFGAALLGAAAALPVAPLGVLFGGYSTLDAVAAALIASAALLSLRARNPA